MTFVVDFDACVVCLCVFFVCVAVMNCLIKLSAVVNCAILPSSYFGSSDFVIVVGCVLQCSGVTLHVRGCIYIHIHTTYLLPEIFFGP